MIRKLAVFFAVCAAAVLAAAPWVPSLVRALTPSPATSEHWFPYTPPTIVEKLGFFVSAFAPMFLIAFCVGLIVVSVTLVLTARRRKAAFAGYIAACMALFALGGGPSLALSAIQQQLLFDQAEDGIHLDFTQSIENGGCCYVKAPGQPAQRGNFTDLFTFTRNSVGTFLGSNGLIQYANANIFTYSEQFNDAAWAKSEATVDANATTGPFGTATADKIVESTANNQHYVGQYATRVNDVGYVSVFAKAAGRDFVRIIMHSSSGGSNFTGTFVDLTDCSLGSTATGGTFVTIALSSQSVGDGWCHVIVKGIITGSGWGARINVASADNVVSYTGDGTSGIYLWGAKANYGVNYGTYLIATDAAAFNQPRIEFDASGNVLGLLIEGARTGFVLQSEDLGTTWANVSTPTLVTNVAVAPDGNTTADTLEDSSAAAYQGKTQSFTVANDSATYTFCAFVGKTSGGTSATFGINAQLSGGTGVSHTPRWNTDTGAKLSGGTVFTYEFANYWRTCGTITNNSTGNTTLALTIYPATAAHGSATDTATAVGTATLWGMGGEAGAFPSSYIPTTTAAVARANDQAVRSYGAEYNLVSGTSVVVGDVSTINASGSQIFFDNDGNGRNLYNPGGASSIAIFDGVTAVSTGVITGGIQFKAASSFGNAGMAISFNGGAVATGAFDGTFGAGVVIFIGSLSTANHIFGHVQSVDHWPYQKPNSFLIRQTLPGRMSFVLPAPANDNAPARKAA